MLLAIGLALSSLGAQGSTQAPPIRFAMTPAFLHDQHALLAEWRGYLEERLKRPVEFVQRDRYRDTMDLLQQQKVEFAWICDYPYVMLRKEVRLMAVAVNEGKPTYPFLPDRPGDRYPDPQHHPPTSKAASLPMPILTRTRVTWFRALRSSVPAQTRRHSSSARFHLVASQGHPRGCAGLVQGGNVDSYVWDVLNKVRPDVTAKTRVAWKSARLRLPPVVASRGVSDADFALMQSVLMKMKDDTQGRALLARLRLDSFISVLTRAARRVAEMMRHFGEILMRRV